MVIKKYIGDRAFYRRVIAVSVPIMIQNAITNLVGLLDNVMVGSIGTEAMSGVSIVNQFIFIFNVIIIGAVSAAGIFTAQYHGKNDVDGVRNTFRFKAITNVAVGIVGIIVFFFCDELLITSFLKDGSTEGDLALTLVYGKEYLAVMLIGLLPWSLSQAYASTMRETGHSTVPMIASAAAVLTNLILNTLLIFGLLGFPALGVVGAAIATVISRFIELFILIFAAHTGKDKYPFARHAYRSLRIPLFLAKDIIKKGLPVMANELFWAAAITARNACYAAKGLDVVAALNIATTVGNLFNVVYMALGSSITIIVGNLLGAGEIEKAKDADRKMMAFSVAASLVMSLILAATAPFFPFIYNTTESVRSLATYLILVTAAVTPFCAYAYCAYYTIRSGGKILITLLFDSVYVWTITFPIAYILSYLTPLGIHAIYLISQGSEVLKAAFGFVLLRKVNWARKIIKD